MNIRIDTYSYEDIGEGRPIMGDDHGHASYALAQVRKKSFLENPSLTDVSDPMLYLGIVDNVVCGRCMSFPTIIKIGDSIDISAVGGSALEIDEAYRNSDLGLMLIMKHYGHSNYYISSDFTKDGIQIQKALKSAIFKLPKLSLLVKSKSSFEYKGFSGFSLHTCSFLFDLFLSIKHFPLRLLYKKKNNVFTVNKVSTVPQWVDSIVMNDGHKYMEVHDHKWLQWCLDNRFHDEKENIQSFYIVTKSGNNIGFFMTKERIKTGGSIEGRMVEWGSADESVLSEFDLSIMAINTFSNRVSSIQVFPSNKKCCEQLLKLGFTQKDYHYVAFLDKTRKLKDVKDQSLWRLRFGYSDSILN